MYLSSFILNLLLRRKKFLELWNKWKSKTAKKAKLVSGQNGERSGFVRSFLSKLDKKMNEIAGCWLIQNTFNISVLAYFRFFPCVSDLDL
jgi:hypothetical protein